MGKTDVDVLLEDFRLLKISLAKVVRKGMGAFGSLVFYTRWKPSDPKEWILGICELSGAKIMESIYKHRSRIPE